MVNCLWNYVTVLHFSTLTEVTEYYYRNNLLIPYVFIVTIHGHLPTITHFSSVYETSLSIKTKISKIATRKTFRKMSISRYMDI